MKALEASKVEPSFYGKVANKVGGTSKQAFKTAFDKSLEFMGAERLDNTTNSTNNGTNDGGNTHTNQTAPDNPHSQSPSNDISTTSIENVIKNVNLT